MQPAACVRAPKVYIESRDTSMSSVEDKVVVVTGAADGIGADIVRAFLQAGAKLVAALDVDENKGRSLESDLSVQYGPEKFKFIKCDVTTAELDTALETVRSDAGYVDIVVNNAGIYNDSPETYAKEIDLNFKATVTSSLKAYTWMREDRGGRGGTVINISSIAALCLLSVFPIYSSTKRAILHFSCCLGMEHHYSRTKVRVITVCFGSTKTNTTERSVTEGSQLQFDEEFFKGFRPTNFYMQSAESAARGVTDAYARGGSGSVWLVVDDKPARDITTSVSNSYNVTMQELAQ